MVHQLKPGVLEKRVQGPRDATKWFPTVLYPAGCPGRTRRCSKNDDECTLLTSEDWHPYVKMAKSTKNGEFWSTIEGPQWTHSDPLSSRGPPEGLETFLHNLWHRETTATSISENPQITASPGLGSLMEIGQHSTMRCAGAKRWTDSETRDVNGGVSHYRVSKLALDVDIFKFKVCTYVVFKAIVRKETSRMLFWQTSRESRYLLIQAKILQSKRSSSALNSRRRCGQQDRMEWCTQWNMVVNWNANWLRYNSDCEFTCSLVAAHFCS